MLGRGYLVVLCLGQDAEFPEFVIEVLHEGSDAGLDDTEVMVIQFLTLGRLCAEQSAAGEAKVGAFVIHFAGDQEIFLLGTDGGDDALSRIIAEETKYPEGLLAENFHGAKQRSLLVKCMSAVGTERCRDAQGLSFYEGVGCRIPGCVAAGFKCRAEAARREGGSVRLTLDELFAGEFHNDAAVRGRGDKAVVLFSRDAGQRLEPVSKMCCTVVDGPVLHGLGDCICHTDIENAALIDRLSEGLIDICGEFRPHDAVVEDHASEII